MMASVKKQMVVVEKETSIGDAYNKFIVNACQATKGVLAGLRDEMTPYCAIVRKMGLEEDAKQKTALEEASDSAQSANPIYGALTDTVLMHTFIGENFSILLQNAGIQCVPVLTDKETTA